MSTTTGREDGPKRKELGGADAVRAGLSHPGESPFAEVIAAAELGTAVIEDLATPEETTPTGTVRTKVGAGYIWLLLLGCLGFQMATVGPVGLSLSLRVQQLLPTHVEVLGYVVGIGSALTAISMPLVGIWSDRVRSRFGRRRPFALVGGIAGIVGLAVMAVATNVWLLGIGWAIALVGWTAAGSAQSMSLADRLPESQRGKVAGLSGFVQMLAAVAGVGVASIFISNNYLVFLAPGAFGFVGALLWVVFVKEADNRHMARAERLTLGKALANMVFNPKRYQDFAWNWLARFFFMIGVFFTSTFMTLFFASRVTASGQVTEVGPLMGFISLFGVLGTAGGALLGGLLSDKFRRRRLFVFLAGVAYAAGATTMAFGGSSMALLITGSVLTSVGLGVFSSVDQAIQLDVLPEMDTEAGRFLGIGGYSGTLAQTVGPVLAAPLLLIGATGGDRNYVLLFILAGVSTLISGILVLTKVRGSN